MPGSHTQATPGLLRLQYQGACIVQGLVGDSAAFREMLVILADDEADAQAREFISFWSMPDYPLLTMVSENYDDALAARLQQTVGIVQLALGVTVPLSVVVHRSLCLLQALAKQNA